MIKIDSAQCDLMIRFSFPSEPNSTQKHKVSSPPPADRKTMRGKEWN
jgi:hypothetical protein